MAPSPNYWLLKTEPEEFSFSQLLREGSTGWSGVRNFQARNFLRSAKKGDLTLIYHTGDEKQIVGLGQVSREAYPDSTAEDGDWVQIDVIPLQPFKTPLPLAVLRSDPRFEGLLLLKQSRLSVVPVSQDHFDRILKLGGIAR